MLKPRHWLQVSFVFDSLFVSVFHFFRIHRFIRKGKAAAFRDEMSEEFIERFDQWTAEHLRRSDFKYYAWNIRNILVNRDSSVNLAKNYEEHIRLVKKNGEKSQNKEYRLQCTACRLKIFIHLVLSWKWIRSLFLQAIDPFSCHSKHSKS